MIPIQSNKELTVITSLLHLVEKCSDQLELDTDRVLQIIKSAVEELNYLKEMLGDTKSP